MGRGSALSKRFLTVFCSTIGHIAMANVLFRGGARLFGKRVHMYKGVGFCFADFISFP